MFFLIVPHGIFMPQICCVSVHVLCVHLCSIHKKIFFLPPRTNLGPLEGAVSSAEYPGPGTEKRFSLGPVCHGADLGSPQPFRDRRPRH